jgi:hypothetical protein
MYVCVYIYTYIYTLRTCTGRLDYPREEKSRGKRAFDEWFNDFRSRWIVRSLSTGRPKERSHLKQCEVRYKRFRV